MGKGEAFSLVDGPSGRARAALEAHGATLARVCMALLGDAAAVERALERVARDAASASLLHEEGTSVLPRLLGLARVACATQLSRVPLRNPTGPMRPSDDPPAPTTSRDPASPQEPNVARAKLARLKPTEREAVVLHLVGGLDVAGVAEACGIDESAAKSRIARGVSQLLGEKNER
ncbi:MAG: hypothetical protein JST00_28785 [Deltaproteobacteria bacterium]|nr:hypothetical protein [Deltaproteobacteria bacterium]